MVNALVVICEAAEKGSLRQARGRAATRGRPDELTARPDDCNRCLRPRVINHRIVFGERD